MKKIPPISFVIALLIISITSVRPGLSASEYKYDSRGRRDPFVPLITSGIRPSLGLMSVEGIEDVKLEGIIFDPFGKSIAVLNGEIVKEGDRTYNVEIVKISDNTITLKIHDIPYTISLVEEGSEAVER